MKAKVAVLVICAILGQASSDEGRGGRITNGAFAIFGQFDYQVLLSMSNDTASASCGGSVRLSSTEVRRESNGNKFNRSSTNVGC
jgi:hypothetical protein